MKRNIFIPQASSVVIEVYPLMAIDENSIYCVSQSDKRYSILTCLSKNEKPLSAKNISEFTKIKTPSVHFHAKVLESHNLISFIWPTEKRALFKITEDGKEALKDIKQLGE